MVFGPDGQPVRKVTDDQIITALNTLVQRNQALQMQVMQLGLLTEFIIDKLTDLKQSNGEPLFVLDEKEFEKFSEQRYAEIKEQAQQFQDRSNQPTVNLED